MAKRATCSHEQSPDAGDEDEPGERLQFKGGLNETGADGP